MVNQFVGERGIDDIIPPTKMSTDVVEGKQPRHKSRRSSAGSASNGGSITPRVPDTGFSVYSGGGVRDYEGVGGVSYVFYRVISLFQSASNFWENRPNIYLEIFRLLGASRSSTCLPQREILTVNYEVEGPGDR